MTPDELSAQVTEKVNTCLFDLIGRAIESADLPWSLQAKRLLQLVADGDASVIDSLETTSSEDNFALLDEPQLHRLVGMITMKVNDEMTRAYPGKQGGEVEVVERGSGRHRERLGDVVVATAADLRERFLTATTRTLGERRATRIEKFIYGIEHHEDACLLAALLGSPANNNGD